MEDSRDFREDCIQAMGVFLDFIASQQRLSPLTVYHYQRDIQLLFQLVHKPPAAMLPEDIRSALVALRKKSLSSRTIARMLSTWRRFFAHLVQVGQLMATPIVDLHPPKRARYLPNMISVDQMMAFFDQAHQHLVSLPPGQPRTCLLMRDVAMVEILYASGLRLSELSQLNIPDHPPYNVSLTDSSFHICGKGGKLRVVPFGRMAFRALHAWLVARATWVSIEESALFINRRGQRLSNRGIELRVAAMSRFLPAGHRLHPHLFRHSFASHLLESSNDLRSVQELLGHASLSSTQVYTHLNFQALSAVYDLTHPRAGKKSSSCE